MVNGCAVYYNNIFFLHLVIFVLKLNNFIWYRIIAIVPLPIDYIMWQQLIIYRWMENVDCKPDINRAVGDTLVAKKSDQPQLYTQ